jgi:hypothetical protein
MGPGSLGMLYLQVRDHPSFHIIPAAAPGPLGTGCFPWSAGILEEACLGHEGGKGHWGCKSRIRATEHGIGEEVKALLGMSSVPYRVLMPRACPQQEDGWSGSLQ